MNPTLSGGTVREARVNLGSVAPRRATEAEAILRGATAGPPPRPRSGRGTVANAEPLTHTYKVRLARVTLKHVLREVLARRNCEL